MKFNLRYLLGGKNGSSMYRRHEAPTTILNIKVRKENNQLQKENPLFKDYRNIKI